MKKKITEIRRHDGKRWVKLYGFKKFFYKMYIKIFREFK